MNKQPIRTFLFAICAAQGLVGALEDCRGQERVWKPLLTQPREVVVASDFSQVFQLERTTWLPRQATRWVVSDGVLRGQPSSEEFQARRKDHRGLEPRLSVPATPESFAMAVSFRFVGGETTQIVPFVEFGHHVCRIRFTRGGIQILADFETTLVAESSEVKLVSGQWYHLFAEMEGEEFVVQFADGPTLYARHPCFRYPAPSGGTGFGVAGMRGGTVEIDRLRIHQVADEPAPDWLLARGKLKTLVHRQLKEKTAAQKAKTIAIQNRDRE